MGDPEFRYATLKIDGREVGGIGEFGAGFPPGVPAALVDVLHGRGHRRGRGDGQQAGGTVTREPWDSPYGRMAIVSDDQGAVFSLMGTRRPPPAEPGPDGPAELAVRAR